MSIRSSAFGGVHLTGKDAEKFLAQVKYGRPKKAALEALARGRPLVERFMRDGYVCLKLKAR